jgi:hypothetical protein
MSINQNSYLGSLSQRIVKILKAEIPGEVVAALFLAFFLNPFIPDTVLTVIVLGLILPAFLNKFSAKINDKEVEQIQNERVKIIQKIEEDQNISDIILLNINQINEYYKINQNQAKNSFRLSISLLLIGFITIISSIVLTLNPTLSPSFKGDVPLLTGISGIVIQFIGGANFVFYNKAVSQLNIYYNQLIKAQDTMLAIELCNKLQSSEQKGQLTEKLVISLIERSLVPPNPNTRFPKDYQINKQNNP